MMNVLISRGLVLRTKKEAIELAEEMLDVARKKFAMAKEATI